MTIRALLEYISRNKVFKRSIFVRNKKYPVYVTPDASLKCLKIGRNAFHRDLIEIAENHLSRDSIVWDCGSNVGIFTFASAVIAHEGTVVSIEADVWLASILRQTARLKAYANSDIRIVPVALSDSEAVGSFLIAARGRASNCLEKAGGRSESGGFREKQYMPTVSLDGLLKSMPSPDFVKIDIEGAELFALQGASTLIGEIRPIFYIEVGHDVSEKVMKIFTNAEYKAFDVDGNTLTESCKPNTFFVPCENDDVGKQIVSQ